MAKSSRLRLCDIRGVCRLVHECRELWDDFPAWSTHLAEGHVDRVGGKVCHFARGSADPMGEQKAQSLVEVGWDSPAQYEQYRGAIHKPLLEVLPQSAPVFARLAPGRGVAVDLYDVVARDAWHRSVGFQVYHRPVDNDAMVVCVRATPGGAFEFLGSSRAVGDRPFTPRDRRLLGLLHAEVAPLIGTRLVLPWQRGRHTLTASERRVLALLLEGLAEADVARRLHRSPATVHRHVTSLYRHFGVTSRAELMARFLRRQPLTPPAPSRPSAIATRRA